VKSFLTAVSLVALASAGCGPGSSSTGAAGTGGGAGTSGAGTSGAGTSGAGTSGGAGSGGAAGVDGGTAGTTGVAGKDGGPTDGGGSDADPNMPILLSQTGLFKDIALKDDVLAAGVFPFHPEYALWSDSATKRRWVYLPPGTKIDTSQMEWWSYPMGFKLWKEFTRDGVRVETRMIMKKGQGAGDWYMMAYKWNADMKDAVAVPLGEMNASGTQHDIPAKEGCATCHQAMYDNALGFTALQLSHPVATAGEVDLDKIKTMGWLTDPPAASFVLPGDATEVAALGYLHANCGNCHNERGKTYMTSADLDLWTHLDQIATVQTTRAYLSSVCDQWPGPNPKVDKGDPIKVCAAGHATGAPIEGSISMVTKRVTPQNPAQSALHELMNLRGTAASKSQMPPIGSEIIDPMGLAKLDAWINKLPLQ
jgi:hypothetical protein